MIAIQLPVSLPAAVFFRHTNWKILNNDDSDRWLYTKHVDIKYDTHRNSYQNLKRTVYIRKKFF